MVARVSDSQDSHGLIGNRIDSSKRVANVSLTELKPKNELEPAGMLSFLAPF